MQPTIQPCNYASATKLLVLPYFQDVTLFWLAFVTNVISGGCQLFQLSSVVVIVTCTRLFQSRLLKHCRQLWKLGCSPLTTKPYGTYFEDELFVQSFCDVYVNLPCNVVIKPLNVHQYHNCDKLKIKLIGTEQGNESLMFLKYIQNGNNVKIFSEHIDFAGHVTCSIKAPIKANLNVIAQGNISTGFCNGSELILKSVNGNITVDNYQGDIIDLTTETGDIVLEKAIVASKIKAHILEAGSITTKRLQGLKAKLITHNGNISVSASYCDRSSFMTKNGSIDMQNIHKSTRVSVTNGNLTLSGLDGGIDAIVENGNADLQLSRILFDSHVTLNNGDLTLRIAEECQENTAFEIDAKNHKINPDLKLAASKTQNVLYLTPPSDDYKNFTVEAKDGSVHILSASWLDMLKLNMQKQH